MEISLEVPQKLKTEAPYDPTIHFKESKAA
jgi:hypothetical protein